MNSRCLSRGGAAGGGGGSGGCCCRLVVLVSSHVAFPTAPSASELAFQSWCSLFAAAAASERQLLDLF
jgi:hypothetical protein